MDCESTFIGINSGPFYEMFSTFQFNDINSTITNFLVFFSTDFFFFCSWKVASLMHDDITVHQFLPFKQPCSVRCALGWVDQSLIVLHGVVGCLCFVHSGYNMLWDRLYHCIVECLTDFEWQWRYWRLDGV